MIPERKDVPGHWHYDVRFVIRALGGEAFVLSEESLDLAWRPVTEVASDPNRTSPCSAWRDAGWHVEVKGTEGIKSFIAHVPLTT